MFRQTLRHNMSSLNQSVEAHLEEAQDFLTDALDINEDMRNLTAVRPDILLLRSITKPLFSNSCQEHNSLNTLL